MFALFLFFLNVIFFTVNTYIGLNGYPIQFIFSALSLFCAYTMYQPALAYVKARK